MITLDDIRRALAPTAWDITIVCHPADEVAIREALEQLGDTPRRARIKCSSVALRGTCYVLDDARLEALEANLFQPSMFRMDLA